MGWWLCGGFLFAGAAFAADAPTVPAPISKDAPRSPASTQLATGNLRQMVFDRARALQHFSAAFAAEPNDPAVLSAYASATPDRMLELALLRRLRQVNGEDVAVQRRIEWIERLQDRTVNRLESPYGSYTLRMPVAYARDDRAVGWVLQVRLNGARPLRLLVDSGARGILISAVTGRRAGLERLAETELGGFGSGPAKPGEVLLAKSLHVGELVFSNVIVEAAPRPDFPADLDGLIGLDLFRQFLITLDGKRSCLRLTPWADADPRDGEGERPWWRHEPAADRSRTLLQSKHLLVVPVQLEGTQVSARYVLDTGAAYSLVQPRGASVIAMRQVSLQGLSGFTTADEVVRPVRLKLPGGRCAVLREAVYADLSTVSAEFGLQLDGFLGFPALRWLVTTIDLRSGSLHVAAE